MPHLTSHLTSPNRPRLISPHIASYRLISPHLASPRLVSPHLNYFSFLGYSETDPRLTRDPRSSRDRPEIEPRSSRDRPEIDPRSTRDRHERSTQPQCSFRGSENRANRGLQACHHSGLANRSGASRRLPDGATTARGPLKLAPDCHARLKSGARRTPLSSCSR